MNNNIVAKLVDTSVDDLMRKSIWYSIWTTYDEVDSLYDDPERDAILRLVYNSVNNFARNLVYDSVQDSIYKLNEN